MEIDPRFGAYNGCTPVPGAPPSKPFFCQPYVNQSKCWWELESPDHSTNFSKLAPLCSRDQCNCTAITAGAVGRYNKPMGQWPVFWHNQTAMWRQIETISDRLDGTWYSTLNRGECKGDARPGSGKCFWKSQRVYRR